LGDHIIRARLLGRASFLEGILQRGFKFLSRRFIIAMNNQRRWTWVGKIQR